MEEEKRKDMGMQSNLLTVKELADRLRVPVSWIYERTRRGQIPHVRLGKYLRFDVEEVLAFLKGRWK